MHKKFLISYKLFFALLGFSAIVTEAATVIERGTFNVINFFSFFTIQVNSLAFIVLILSAVFLAANKSKSLDILRAATTVYILIVGIGFAILLAGLEGVELTAVPWDNTVLHYIIPAAVLVDYLIDRPKTKLSFKKSLLWLIYPAIYVIYSLARGPIAGWYPYPFLNPNVTSVGQTATVVLCLFVLGTIFIAIAIKLSGRKSTK